MIEVEVAHARPEKQKLLRLAVPEGTTMLEAARRSGIVEHFPDLELEKAPMGIFGTPEADPARRALVAGDRVEIYRPLEVDPREARRARAARR